MQVGKVESGWGRHGVRCYQGKLSFKGKVVCRRWFLKCSGIMLNSYHFLLYEVDSDGIRVTGDLSHSQGTFVCSSGAAMLGPALLHSCLCLALSCSGQTFFSTEKPGRGVLGSQPCPSVWGGFLGAGLHTLWPGRAWHMDLCAGPLLSVSSTLLGIAVF